MPEPHETETDDDEVLCAHCVAREAALLMLEAAVRNAATCFLEGDEIEEKVEEVLEEVFGREDDIGETRGSA